MRNVKRSARVVSLLLAAVLLMSALLVGSVPSADATYSDATTKNYEEQIAALKKQQQESRNRLAALRTQEYSANAQKE